MTNAERKEKERLRSAARRAKRAADLAGINADLAKVMPGKPVRAAVKARFAKVAKTVNAATRKAAKTVAATKATVRKMKSAQAPEAMHAISFRGTDAQHAAFNKLGAGAWVRKLLDKHA